jgi:STE24 endopeptidase
MRKSCIVLLLLFVTPVLVFLGNFLFQTAWQIVQQPPIVHQSSIDSSTEFADSGTGLVKVPEPTPDAVRFHYSGVALIFLYKILDVLFPMFLIVCGLHVQIRNWCFGKVHRHWLCLGLFVLILILIRYVFYFPIDFYTGFIRSHQYGLSQQSLVKWLLDGLKETLLLFVGLWIVVSLAYFLLRKSPNRWWIYAALLSIPLSLFFMLIKPLWVDPLFNHFGPMEDHSLEQKIIALSGKAGVSGVSVYEVKKSVDTKTINAYVTGFLGSKRIVLWDNAINKLNERQLLFVVGHELGHYVLNHIIWTICFVAVLILIVLWIVQLTSKFFLQRASRFLGFKELSDIASLPWFIMLLQIYGFIFSPITMAYSRHNEHEADRFGLELTHDNYAAATGFVRMQKENLRVPRPLEIYTIFFATHPSLADRIEFCNSYHPWEKGDSENTGISN